jgi:protein-S-isoprenylcysteine O-methyltransferase Ste14
MNSDSSGPPKQEPRRLHSAWMVACGGFLFRFRNALFPVLFLVLMLVTRPAQFLNNPAWDRVAMFIGAVIALSGQALRMWVIGFAYIKRGGRNGKVHADELVVAGLYAHSRNPMYFGNFLIACGVSIFYGSPWMYGLVIPFFAWAYLAITAAEEEFLVGKFGAAYEDYTKRVNRFVPDFRGISASLAGYRYRWRYVLAKEHGTLFATLAGLTVIAMWKKYWIYGWEAQKHEILSVARLLIPWIIFYVTIRFLKIAGRLKGEIVATSAESGVAS